MISSVIKRDGSTAPFDPEKLNKWAEYAARQGVSESELAQETFKQLEDNCTTSDIHDAMIKVCLSKKDRKWSKVAARLEFATIRKGMKNSLGLTDKNSFKDIYTKLCVDAHWNYSVLPKYNPMWESWYEDLTSTYLECWQIKQWMDKYALRDGNHIIETPHIGALGIGLAIHGDTLDAYHLAKSIITSKVNLPTPVLNGCRNGDFDSISCCVISGGDTVESIEVAKHIATRMTAKKAGIGIEYRTRSKNEPVKKGRIKHLGKTPIYAAVDKAVKMFTQVSRGGSATVSYRANDPQIEELLLLKSQRTPENVRLDKLDYSFVYNDAFVDAVVRNQVWNLYTYFGQEDLYENFHLPTDQYLELASKYKPAVTLKARDLLKTFLTVRAETGRVYCMNMTRANIHTPFIDTIHLSNLCVAPETQILTDKGYIVISELENEVVNVWNGEEFSQTTVRKTGSSQELIKVVTDSGHELECTPYHKFYLADGYSGKHILRRANQLKVGDTLIKYDLPIIKGTKKLHKAYQNGFFSADGCTINTNSRIYLYGGKKSLEHMFDLQKRQEQPNQDRVYGNELGLKHKFFVPDASYTIKSRLDWLAGYMDGDGCIYRNGNNEQLVASSVEPEFLREVQFMLQTLGVDSKVQLMTEAGFRKLPKNDGTNTSDMFMCKTAYRIIINSNGLFNLHQLGIHFHRLVTTERLPQRSATHFIKVVAVEETGRIDDTYCFTETNRGMGMFGGILTGQCQEIMLPTHPYTSMPDLYFPGSSTGETAFCSLAAVNVSNVASHEYEHIADVCVRTINRLIDLAPMMAQSMMADVRSRRSIGVGITGLAGWIYAQGLDYDSPQTEELVQDLAEQHYYWMLKASQHYSQLNGVAVQGINKDWLPIDTMISKHPVKLDWEPLRGKDRANSVLVAHMPTESSAVNLKRLQGVTLVEKLREFRETPLWAILSEALNQWFIERATTIPKGSTP